MKHISLIEYKNDYPDWEYFRFQGYSPQQLRKIEDWAEYMLGKDNFRVVGWNDGCVLRYGFIVSNQHFAFMTRLTWDAHGLKYEGEITDEIDDEEFIEDFLEDDQDYEERIY